MALNWRRSGLNWEADGVTIWPMNFSGTTVWRVWIDGMTGFQQLQFGIGYQFSEVDYPHYCDTLEEAKAYAEAMAPFAPLHSLR